MTIDIARWLQEQDDELVLYDPDGEALPPPAPSPDLGRPEVNDMGDNVPPMRITTPLRPPRGEIRPAIMPIFDEQSTCPGPDEWRRRHPGEDVSSAFTRPWPAPTIEDYASLAFQRVWDCVRRWDINVPDAYAGYRLGSGAHAKEILAALGELVQRT